MSVVQPTLAEGFAHLRTAAQAEPAPFWLPDTLHAMIMALIASIFGRLEQLALAWSTGTLPQPPIRTAPRRTAARTPNNRRAHASRPRHRRGEAHAGYEGDGKAATLPTIPPATRTPGATAPLTRRARRRIVATPANPARAPPSAPHPVFSSPARGRKRARIILRNSNIML